MTERETYYANARTWADSEGDALRRSRRTAWIVAAVAAATAFVLALALAALTPLKTVAPYVLTVDRATGTVERAQTLEPGKLTQNEAVIAAELANFVRARETFDETDLAAQYRRVALRSAGPARAAYEAQMAAANPQSPLRTLTRGDTVAVTVRSVSTLGPGQALVRFATTRTAADGRAAPPQTWVAAIAFGFTGAPLTTAERFDNPLGFQVTRYRRDVDGAP